MADAAEKTVADLEHDLDRALTGGMDDAEDLRMQEFSTLELEERLEDELEPPAGFEDVIDIAGENIDVGRITDPDIPALKQVLGDIGTGAASEAGFGTGAAIGAAATANPLGALFGGALGAGIGFFTGEYFRSKAADEDFDATQAGEDAAFMSAITTGVPLVGKIINLGAKATAATARKMKKIAVAARVGKEIKLLRPAEALTRFFDREATFAKAFPTTIDDFNRFHDNFKEHIQRFPEALKRVEKKGFINPENKVMITFKEIADGLRSKRKEIGSKLGKTFHQVQKEAPDLARINPREIDFGSVESDMLSRYNEPTTVRQAAKEFQEQIESVYSLALSPAETKTRANAVAITTRINNKINKNIPRIESQTDEAIGRLLGDKVNKKTGEVILGKEHKLFREAQEIIQQTDELIEANGISFVDLFEKKKGLDKTSFFDVPAEIGNRSSKAVTRRLVADALRAKIRNEASELSQQGVAVGDELITLLDDFGDVATVEPYAFLAEAAETQRATRRLLLGFGPKAAAAREIGAAAQSSRFALIRHNLHRKVEAALEAGTLSVQIPDAAASAVNFPSKTAEMASKLVDNAGMFTADVGMIMATRKGELGGKAAFAALSNATLDALMFDRLRDAGLVGASEDVVLEELANAGGTEWIDQNRGEVAQLLEPFRNTFEGGSEEEVALTLSQIKKSIPGLFPESKTGLPGEVRVGGKVRLPDLTDRKLYAQSVRLDTSLDKGQKARMISAVNEDGSVIEAPKKTTVRRESIIPEADMKLEEDEIK